MAFILHLEPFIILVLLCCKFLCSDIIKEKLQIFKCNTTENPYFEEFPSDYTSKLFLISRASRRLIFVHLHMYIDA